MVTLHYTWLEFSIVSRHYPAQQLISIKCDEDKICITQIMYKNALNTKYLKTELVISELVILFYFTVFGGSMVEIIVNLAREKFFLYQIIRFVIKNFQFSLWIREFIL